MYFHGTAVIGRRQNNAHVAHAAHGHLHRTRNGRSGKREHVNRFTQVLELLFMPHAEALLFINNDKAQIMRVHIARKQAMRAHQNLNGAIRESLERFLLLCRRTKTRENFHMNAEWLKALLEVRVMLLRQNSSRAQHHNLLLILRCLECRSQCDFRFAETDIAADQAVHRTRAHHVCFHIANSAQLIGCFRIREGGFHLALPGRIFAKTKTLHRTTTRIHIYQVKREFLCCLTCFAQRTRPVRRVQARQSRRRPFWSHIARHAVKLLNGNKQAIPFCVFQKKVVTHTSIDFLTRKLAKKRYAMNGVHNVIAWLVGKRDFSDIDFTPR